MGRANGKDKKRRFTLRIINIIILRKKNMDKQKFYCDDCKYLRPKEKNQTYRKEHHVCIKANLIIKHAGQHPRLPRPNWCIMGDYYE